MLIIVVLFITLANLKQLIYEKALYLKIVDICKKYFLSFKSTQDSFLNIFNLVYSKWLVLNIVWTSMNL